VQADVKMKNGKKIKVKALVDSRYIYIQKLINNWSRTRGFEPNQ